MPDEIRESSISYDFRRGLYTNIENADLKSNQCKNECIDKDMNFCATSDYTKGFCCRKDEKCPRASICSEDNPKAPSLFKYLVCPNEAACESKQITPEMDGTILKRSVDKYEFKFVKDDVCSYIVKTPLKMGEYDKMFIKIYNIDKADIYIAKGKGYMWLDHLDRLVNEGDQFDTSAGWQFYVVGVANSMFKGTFSLKIWVE
jgi:hypothetical protein